MFIGRNRLICVFKSFVPKNDALGDHITLFEPKYCDKCTRQDFLTRQEKKEPVENGCAVADLAVHFFPDCTANQFKSLK